MASSNKTPADETDSSSDAAGMNERKDSSAAEQHKVHPNNKLNDLTSREWIKETVSVWTQRGLGG